MRQSLLDQLPLVPVSIDHDHAREFGAVSALLDQLPEAVQLANEDLRWRGKRRVDPSQGRHGLAADQVLRAAVLKQMSRFSCEQLAFHLADSATYRSFCRLGFDRRPPKKATLQKNVKRVKPETWQAINEMLVLEAQQLGVEDGRKVRSDCTVVESNIHHPNDSSLLWDSVRVLARLMARAREDFGIPFHDHRRRAKRRAPRASSSPKRLRNAATPIANALAFCGARHRCAGGHPSTPSTRARGPAATAARPRAPVDAPPPLRYRLAIAAFSAGN